MATISIPSGIILKLITCIPTAASPKFPPETYEGGLDEF